MMAKVSQFLSERTDAVIAAALAAMERSHLPHYEKVGSGVAGERLRALYALVVRCTDERHLSPMLAHAERIARERHAAGIDLNEVQIAINVLEEAIWRAVLAEIPAEEQGEALGAVGTVLGAAKDRLACTYVSLVAKKPTRTLDLGSLFSGTSEGDPAAE
jgi:hypothetical protein